MGTWLIYPGMLSVLRGGWCKEEVVEKGGRMEEKRGVEWSRVERMIENCYVIDDNLAYTIND